MDTRSPEHLEPLRFRTEIKAVLLRRAATPDAAEIRFEREEKDEAYWTPINERLSMILAEGAPKSSTSSLEVYGCPCVLLVVPLVEVRLSPFAIAVMTDPRGPVDDVRALLHRACHDYWYGSYFFK